jgi:putative hydrolase of the HAD superfamily
MNNQKIKAVIFDWGGVLCDEAEPFASIPLQKKLGMEPNAIADKAREIYNGNYTGKYNHDDFWHAIMVHYGLEETEEINPAALSLAYVSSYRIYDEMLVYVTKLKKNYKTAILSNLSAIMRDHIRPKHNLSQYFDVEVYSCDVDVQAMKPDKKPYLVCLEKLGVRPEESIFVENTAKNLITARELGMQEYLFMGLDKFLDEFDGIIKN